MSSAARGSLAARLQLEPLLASTLGAAEVVVAMIDGPVDASHPALRAAEIRGVGSAPEAACRIAASPACLHGTMVAGILAADRSSAAPGLCPGCTLLVRPIFCEALDLEHCPIVTPGDLALALREVIDAGARIVNLSVGLAGGATRAAGGLRRAYDEARRRGVLLVAASGNQGSGCVSALFDHPWVVPVAAADADGRLAADSNRCDGLLAPGVDVTSTAPGGGFRSMSGTSLAAPFVTGTLALLWSLWPDADAEQLRRAVLPGDTAAGGVRPLPLDGDATRRRLATELLGPTLSPSEQRAEKMTDSPIEVEPFEETPPPASQEPPPPAVAVRPAAPPSPAVQPQCGCGAAAGACSCGVQPADRAPAYIYALGEIKVLFPSLGLQKEFEFAATRLGVAATDYYGVLSQPQYLYIAELVCWVLSISDQDVYFVQPRSQTELQDLIGALKPTTDSPGQPTSLVVGLRGPTAPPDYCSGLQLPIVLCNQLYYFDFEAVFATLKSQDVEAESIKAVMEAMDLKPNDGSTDADRALNYVAFRFPEIYQKADELSDPDSTPGGPYKIVDITTSPSTVESTRTVVDVVFKYQQVSTQEQLFYYTGVDVTGQFPFLNTPLRQYVPVS